MVIPSFNVWIWDIPCLNVQVCDLGILLLILVSIFYDFKTNNYTLDILHQTKISIGHLYINQDYHSFTMDFSPISFLASLCCRLRSIAPPFGPVA